MRRFGIRWVVPVLAMAMLAGLAVDRASALTLVYTNAVLRNPGHPQWGGITGTGSRDEPFPGPGTSNALGLELFTDITATDAHIDVDKFFLGIEWFHMTWVRDPGDPDIITLSEGIENLTGLVWHGYRVQLGGATFVPDQDPLVNPVPVGGYMSPAMNDAILYFDPPLPSGGGMYDLTIGTLNGVPDPGDVQIDISQVAEGGFFTIRQYPLVPEPVTLALLGAPLGILIWRRRRR